MRIDRFRHRRIEYHGSTSSVIFFFRRKLYGIQFLQFLQPLYHRRHTGNHLPGFRGKRLLQPLLPIHNPHLLRL